MMHPDPHDELREAPVLRSIPKVDPFLVPDGFFERFPHAVQERVATKRRPSVLGGLLRPAIAACSLLAVVIITWVLWPKPASELPQIAVSTYETPEHVSDELEAEELFTALSTDEPLLAEVDVNLTDAELADYIEQEELPLDLLIEEL